MISSVQRLQIPRFDAHAVQNRQIQAGTSKLHYFYNLRRLKHASLLKTNLSVCLLPVGLCMHPIECVWIHISYKQAHTCAKIQVKRYICRVCTFTAQAQAQAQTQEQTHCTHARLTHTNSHVSQLVLTQRRGIPKTVEL